MAHLLELEIGTFLSWLGIFLSIYIGWKSITGAFNVQYKMNVAEEQLNKVYLPVFRLLEPFLYKKYHQVDTIELERVLKKIDQIIQMQYKYVHSSFIDYNAKLLKGMSTGEKPELMSEWLYQYSWNVDYQFEKTRKRLYLPTRSLQYKLNQNQFKNKILLLWSISRHYVVEALIIALLSVMMTAIIFMLIS